MEEFEIESDLLHDSLLRDILIDREKESVAIRLITAEFYHPELKNASIIAEKVSSFTYPMENPWGRSSSVNEVNIEGKKLEIEMQSGDSIVIEAESFKIVKNN